ncbi:MAG: SPOR domain-containing protein [Steroidobacteraceae bacterium]
MESRIKERLTGALILVAALVVLVPEIFSGRRGSEKAETAPVAAPALDAPPLRTYTSEPDAAAPPLVQAPVAAAPPIEERTPERVEAPQPERVSPPVQAAAPAQPPRSAPVVETKPSTPPPARTEAAAPASGEWYVQVGSFSQVANAQRYAQQLRGEGFTAIVLPAAGSKGLIRVRVGPARSRDAAAQLLGKLTSAGHKGAVVGP